VIPSGWIATIWSACLTVLTNERENRSAAPASIATVTGSSVVPDGSVNVNATEAAAPFEWW